ncbi:MAG: LytTR family DNA-binding domain-containing protein [Pseudomonadota bacterium]
MSPSDPSSSVDAPNPWRYQLLAWALASLVTAVIGPFTTFANLSFAERLAYWASLIGLAVIMGHCIRAMVLRVIQPEGLKSDLVGAAIHALVLGPVIWGINFGILRFDIWGAGWILQHILVVFLVCLAIVVIRQYGRRIAAMHRAASGGMPAAVNDPPRDDGPAVPTPAFLKQLDDCLGRDLLRVSADDHYLLVVTRSGEGRVRMRFRDALEELQNLPGHQIHRSHWIARDALVGVRAEGRRYVAALQDGSEVPVSRAGFDDLREAGLIDAANVASASAAAPDRGQAAE